MNLASRLQHARDRLRRSADRQLHWTLLALQLVLLGSIVAGFALLTYWNHARGVLHQSEADLLGAAQMMVESLRRGALPEDLAIPQTYFHRFGPAPRDRAYFAVWDRTGRALVPLDKLPAHVAPPARRPEPAGPRPFDARQTGRFLDVSVATPGNGVLLIGRRLSKEYDGLARMMVELIAIAGVCLVIGAAAAWWVARLIAAPIERMAAQAQQISSRRLQERLAIPTFPVEVGALAAAFNETLARLESAFERQRRFTADASHELRTPVSILLTQSEHSLARDRTPAEYRAALETCRQTAFRMRRLVDDLLLLAKTDDGRLNLLSEPLDLADVARTVAGLLLPDADAHELKIADHLAAAPVLGDRARLEQVAFNLVANAIQHSLPGGTIRIRTGGDGQDAVLSVQDEGSGIAAAQLPHLFERFFRVDAARTHESGTGSGLGLNICAEIVAAHGGTIGAASSLGVGTTVTVRLPVRDAAAAVCPS